jgi:hypothetical protein
MKRIFFSLALTGLVLILGSCEKNTKVNPSGNVTTELVTITAPYSGLEVGYAFDVEVEFSDEVKPVEIIADDNVHPYIIADVVNGVLRIRLQDNLDINGSVTLKANITTEMIKDFSASGASLIDVLDTIQADQSSIYLSGASNFTAALTSATLRANLSGASLLNLSGELTDFDLVCSGASIVGGFEMEAANLDTDLSGASIVRLTVTDQIDITASGASILYFEGGAAINSSNLSGGSQIISSK